MRDRRRFIVMGAGGHGKVVADAGACAGLELVGFVDDNARDGQTMFSVPVWSWDALLGDRQLRSIPIALAIGNNPIRQRVRDRLRADGFQIATILHPAASVARSARVGEGSVVLAHAVINAEASVESGAIVNTAAVIEHDCVVGEFAHVASNATLAGGVRVGARSVIGPGAVVARARVGSDATVGPGTAVVSDVADGASVPA